MTVTRRDVVVAGHTGDHALVAEAVHSPDAQVRAAALGALERLCTLEDAHVATALDDPDPAVRRRAAELAAGRPAVDLLGALSDPDASVVEMAAWSCGEHEVVGDHVLDRLVELTTTADEPLVRESCAAALGAIGDVRGLPAILAACGDKPAIRRRAVLALAPFLGHPGDGAAEAEAAVEQALTDRDWQVRQSAEDLRRAGRGSII